MVIAARSTGPVAGENYKVLMMRRNARGSFASAWVFPGGVVEESDSDTSLAGNAPVDASTHLRIGESSRRVVACSSITVKWCRPG